jgi:hypothetical protein
MCSHYYVAYPPFEVAEDDENERALRIAARTSSGRDLVEEFIGYGVWPLAHGWVLGEVCPREMPSLGGRKVRSPLFALDVRGWDPVAVVREAEDGAVRIVGRYVPKTEALWSWDIRGSNDRLNRVFELNRLPYGGYPGEDVVDRHGKKTAAVIEEDPAQEAAPATKKRKLGTVVGELGVSDSFGMELTGTCVAPGGRMSSPELRESSARMLEVTGGRWPKNVPIPRTAGEDFFTTRMARDLRVFPYGRNIATVVSVVMNKDRQDAAQKRRAVVRMVDPVREAKRARGSAKDAASGSGKLVPAAKMAAPGGIKASMGEKATKPPPGGPSPAKLPPPGKRVADFGTNISVDDYLVGKYIYIFDRRHVAGSGEGQLVVVPPSVAATSPSAVVKAKGATQDPWAAFCTSGEILTAAAARDVAGTMSQRLREVSQQLSQQLTQQLKQVSCAGLRCLLCFGSCVCVS